MSSFPTLSLEQTGWIDERHPSAGHSHQRKPSTPTTGIPSDTKHQEKQTAHPISSNTAYVTQTFEKLSEEDKEDVVWEVISRTLPQRKGERNACIFDLARALKSIAPLAEADAEDVQRIVRKWHIKALAVIGTKAWGVTWQAFKLAWSNVLFPIGSGPLDEALRSALANPLPIRVGKFRDEPTLKLLLVCRELQQLARGGSFYLSCRSAAQLCGFRCPMTASRRLKALCESEGILRLVERGTSGDGRSSTRKATRYRLISQSV